MLEVGPQLLELLLQTQESAQKLFSVQQLQAQAAPSVAPPQLLAGTFVLIQRQGTGDPQLRSVVSATPLNQASMRPSLRYNAVLTC